VRTPDTNLCVHYANVSGKDISTLRGLNWLNDEVINFYMQAIINMLISIQIVNLIFVHDFRHFRLLFLYVIYIQWYVAASNIFLKWLERLTVNAYVAIVLGSIPASSDTAESEGRQMKLC
jgi:hypothetical protein